MCVCVCVCLICQSVINLFRSFLQSDGYAIVFRVEPVQYYGPCRGAAWEVRTHLSACQFLFVKSALTLDCMRPQTISKVMLLLNCLMHAETQMKFCVSLVFWWQQKSQKHIFEPVNYDKGGSTMQKTSMCLQNSIWLHFANIEKEVAVIHTNNF